MVLPGSHMRATCAFSVNRTWIQRIFSSSFHLFRAAMLSKWLIHSSKFPVPSNFSANTSGQVIVYLCSTSTGGSLSVALSLRFSTEKHKENQFTCVSFTLVGTVGCHGTHIRKFTSKTEFQEQLLERKRKQ